MTRSERFATIERLLQTRRALRFDDLQGILEVSRATLHRDLQYLRDRMRVPILCDRNTGIYRIDNNADRYELPGMWFSAKEIHALLSMQQLLSSIDPGGVLNEQIAPLQERLLTLLESKSYPADTITRRVRILCAAPRHHASRHFQTIASALMERQRLQIRYLARSHEAANERKISPQRLIHYRDNWYLDAWCHLRDELRRFSIDAIQAAEILPETACEIADDELDQALAASYGIFSGVAVQWATLLFTAERARWVAAEHWHPEQQGEFLPDGRYQLRVPYSRDPELIMDILKYGPDCEVMGPEKLREKVVGLLKAAVGRYEDE